ncbi:MAG: leucine-rich repeat protein [Lachnospiraceae bacterium]|nr:leucine-rich repeat protein [Lachnospiraceae bacterium]
MRKRISRTLSCILAAAMIITGTGVPGFTSYEAYGMAPQDEALYGDDLSADAEEAEGILLAYEEGAEADNPVEGNLNEDALVEEPLSENEELTDSEELADASDEEAVLSDDDTGLPGSELAALTMFNTYIDNGNNTDVVSGATVPMGTDIYGRAYTYKDGGIDHKAFYVWAEGENTRMTDSYSSENGYYKDNDHVVKDADTIVVEEGITHIGNHGFCGGGASVVLLPGTITDMGGYAFSEMPNLASINLNACTGLETIPTEAFSVTPKLKSIAFPDSVTVINYGAFRSCGLETLVLPKALKQIGGGGSNGAFTSCPDLVSTEETPIVIPKSLETCYTEGAFRNCPEIEYLEFEEGMTNIPQHIGMNLTNMTSVKLPSTAVEIGIQAFKNCSNLKTVNFNNAKIKTMKQQVFEDCKALEEITLPATLTDIGSNAFKNCTSLKHIRIPDGVTETVNTFEGCTSLESVVLPDTFVSAGNRSFYDCTSLKQINWPSSLSHIGQHAFRGTAFEGEISLPDHVVQIDDYAFSTCLSVNKVIFPGSICIIGIDPLYSVSCDYVFRGNSKEWKKVTVYKPGTSGPYTDNADSEITKHLTYTIKDEDYVEPTDISLKKSTFKKGDRFSLEAVVSPEGASRNVTWKGYSSYVVKPVYTWGSQYTTGEFTALKTGKFNVTCSSKDGVVSKSFEITITEDGDDSDPTPTPTPGPSYDVTSVAGLTLNKTAVSLYPGDALKLSATLMPADAKDKTVIWSSDKPAMASVDANGNVKALKADEDGTGKAIAATVTITATAKGAAEGKVVKDSCVVTVLPSEIVDTDDKGAVIKPDDKQAFVQEEEGKGEARIWVAGIDNNGYYYTGNAIKPAIHVYKGYKLLTEKTDYTLVYKNNKNVSKSGSVNVTENKKKPQIIIKMKGAYSGNETAYFNIIPMPIDKLTADNDMFSVEYKAGKKNLLKPTLMYDGNKVKYNAKDITFKWYEADESGNATETESECIEAKTYAVKAFAGESGNYSNPSGEGKSGHKVATVIVSGRIPMSKVKLEGFRNKLAYEGGKAVSQNAILTYKDKGVKSTLSECKVPGGGGDYTVTHMNNYDLGTATVIYEAARDASGKYTGKYSGKVVKTYKIAGKYTLKEGNAGNCIVSLNSVSYPYANAQIKPEVKVTAKIVNNNGVTETRTLIQGRDYTVSYKNNKTLAAANAKKNGRDIAPQVIVKGKGNYVFADTSDMKKGLVKRFEIRKADLGRDVILTISDIAYNKTAGKYKKTKLLFTDKDYMDLKLKEGKDYTVSYTTSDRSEAPAAGQSVAVTITAKDGGSCTGSVTGSYRITDRNNTDISKVKVVINPNANGKTQPCTYTGSGIEPGQEGQPKLILTAGSGRNAKTLNPKEIKDGKVTGDYEILGYYNNILPGNNAVILIRGIGEKYRGIRAVKFKISAVRVTTRWGGVYGQSK